MAVSNNLEIKMYMHCGQCLSELPKGTSPAEYARLGVGFTEAGLQIWCQRHDCNVANIDFEGVHHPANTTCKKKENNLS